MRNPDNAATFMQRFALQRVLGMAVLMLAAVLVGVAMATFPPLLVLGALIGAGLLLLMLARPMLATLTFAFLLYGNVLVVVSQFYGISSLVSGSVALILALPLASYLIIHHQPIVFTRLIPLMLLYMLVMLTSAIVNGSVQSSMAVMINYLSEGLLLYFLMVNVIRSFNILHRVISILLLSGAIMGGLSLYQELTRDYTNAYGGFAQVNMEGFVVGETVTDTTLRPRLEGPIGDANRYAQILGVLLPLGVFRLFSERSRAGWLFAALTSGLILVGVALSFSRGAAVALIGLFGLMVLWRYLRISQAMLIGLIGIVLIVAVAPDFVVRLTSLQGLEGLVSDQGEAADGALRGRTTSNLAALYVVLDHPALGVGPGQYYQRYSRQYANTLGIRYFTENRRAHNLYLETAADLGLIGLGVMLSILVLSMVELWQARHFWQPRSLEMAHTATALLMSLIFYMFTAIFLHLSYQRYFWFLLALIHGFLIVQKPLQARLASSALVRDDQNDIAYLRG